MHPNRLSPLTISIIGTGALGSALFQFFKSSESVMKSYWNSSGGVMYDQDEKQFVKSSQSKPTHKHDLGDWIFITTPDDVIPKICEHLLQLSHDWQGISIIHCSGGLTSSVLKPLQKMGADIASVHPIQTFGKGDDQNRFYDIYMSIEGDDNLHEPLQNLVKKMGATPLVITADIKQKIHIAAVMASNYIVSLLGSAEAFLEKEGIDNGLEILKPLITQTIDNIHEKGVVESLSGPIARGDKETIKNHLSLIEDNYSKELYGLLGREAVRIAQKGNRIDEAKAEQLMNLLKLS